MKQIAFVLVVVWISKFTAIGNAQPLADEVEKTLREVEDEKKTLSARANAVDMLLRMSATTAGPRLLKLLIDRHSYGDVVDDRILGFFSKLPTAEAVSGLLNYEAFARQNNIEMMDKISTSFVAALEACKKVVKEK